MSIRILPKDVASKIAAGEVVERPVSVVKELIENSIDAGASEITIRISEGGRKHIEITDNGSGISSADAEIAAQRYATSKIAAADDLEKIHTLGFRGEALASISAVSRTTITSRTDGEQTGFNCQIEGGEIQSVREIGRPIGTKITVKDLFYNVPARLKFLKKDSTERRLINQIVSRYALFYADIRFHLVHDGKQILLTSGNGDQREILLSMFDIETAKNLLPISYSDEYLSLEGFTSPINLTRASRRDMYYFINGRLISDAAISSAVLKGYYGLMMVGRYPISILYISLPPQEVDVNVHPTKAEIRFRDSSRIFSIIHRAVRKTISAYSSTPVIPPSVWASSPTRTEEVDLSGPLAGSDHSLSLENLQPKQGTPVSRIPFTNIPLLRRIGQLGQTYIAAEGPDGLYLIDQHAAHERILFEKLTGSETKNPSQLLLEPVTLSVSRGDVEEINALIDLIHGIGFKIEEFGPQSFRITAVPQILTGYDPKEAILSIVESDDENNDGLLGKEKKDAVVTRICKRLAVKAGKNLSPVEQETLLRDLENCVNPRTCPHGRPTMVHISVDSLARQFGRKGSI